MTRNKATGFFPMAVLAIAFLTSAHSASAYETFENGLLRFDTDAPTVTPSATYNAAPQVTLDIVSNKSGKTITFTDPADQDFAPGATFNAPVGTDSGLIVLLVSNSNSVCTVSGNTVSIVTAGTCALTASQVGDDLYSSAANVIRLVNIARARQVITGFSASPTSGEFNGSSTLSANTVYLPESTKSTNFSVAFASLTPQICSVTGNVVKYGAIGICTVTADQAGDANHQAAQQEKLDITVHAIVPDAPVITAFETGFNRLTVYSNPSISNGGSPVINYIVECDGHTVSGLSSPIVVEGLRNGEEYNCTIVAENIAGFSVPASIVGIGLPTYTIPTLSNWGQLLLVLIMLLVMIGYTRKVRFLSKRSITRT